MSVNFWKLSFQFMLLSVTLLVGDAWMDGIQFESKFYALITALVLMLLNRFVKPLLLILTIPATIFTFGFFILIINALILMLASEIVPEFGIKSFWSAFWLSILISIVQVLFGQNNSVQVKVKKNDDEFDEWTEVS
jgi:putative membrane protein